MPKEKGIEAPQKFVELVAPKAPTMQVVVPQTTLPGAVLQVPHPTTGQEIELTVPPNTAPGTTLTVAMPAPQSAPQHQRLAEQAQKDLVSQEDGHIHQLLIIRERRVADLAERGAAVRAVLTRKHATLSAANLRESLSVARRSAVLSAVRSFWRCSSIVCSWPRAIAA